MLGIDDLRRRGVLSYGSGLHGGDSSLSAPERAYRHNWSGSRSNQYGNAAVALSKVSTFPKRDLDIESQSSQSKIIRKTQTFTIERDPVHGGDIMPNSDELHLSL